MFRHSAGVDHHLGPPSERGAVEMELWREFARDSDGALSARDRRVAIGFVFSAEVGDHVAAILGRVNDKAKLERRPGEGRRRELRVLVGQVDLDEAESKWRE